MRLIDGGTEEVLMFKRMSRGPLDDLYALPVDERKKIKAQMESELIKERNSHALRFQPAGSRQK